MRNDHSKSLGLKKGREEHESPDPGALLWIHGHTHSHADYQIDQTRVLGNPKGYPHENTDFRPELVIEV